MAFCVCTGFAGNVYAEEGDDTTEHVVTFVLNGADNADDPAFAAQMVKDGETATYPTVDPSKDGYVFDGWKKDAEGTEWFSFGTAITEDTVVYACFAKIYTITYDCQGGTAIEPLNLPEGVTLCSVARYVTTTREGYTFTGWYLEPECTTLLANFSADPIYYTDEYKLTGDTTLYAGWESNGGETEMVTVTFVSNGDQGTFTKEYKKGYVLTRDEILSDPDLAVTRTDETGSFEFEYWDAFSQADSKYTLESDMTVTASWLYTLKFETNGGTLRGGMDAQASEFDSFVMPVGHAPFLNLLTNMGDYRITREGYTFDGWYLDPEFTTLSDENYTTNYNGEKAVTTVYAKWIPNATTDTNKTTGRPTPNTGSNDHTRGLAAATLLAVAGAAVLIKKRREM